MLDNARRIRLLAMDVDGVLTAGEIFYSDRGEETKAFNIQDGLGIAVARHAGLMTAIVTGRESPAVERRARELKITYLRQGCRDKSETLRSIIAEAALQPDEVAFIGDDINDIPAFGECGLRIAVQDASQDLKAIADYITERRGGNGAVREAIEFILSTQGKWSEAVEQYLRCLKAEECQT